jgi:hypothetical protein
MSQDDHLDDPANDGVDDGPGPWAIREDACAGTLDRISELQKQICAIQAEQIRLLATFVGQRNELDADLGVPSGPAQYRCLVAEVAIACNFSNLTAQSFLADAYSLATAYPCTLAALDDGTVNLSAARAVAREARLLDGPDAQALADRVIAEELPDVSPGRVRALVEQRVIEIDPDAAARRAVQERADRHVSIAPGTPGTAYLNAYLPAEQATACWHALHDQACSRRADGDPRSISHLMCDTLVERLTGVSRPGDTKVHVNLVMADTTLLGGDDNPAELTGCGPIPATVARLIATTGNTWVKRLYSDPVDSTLVAADSRRRRFDGALREFVIARDRHCRGIKCASPIRDIDHLEPHADGGRTTATNGHGLSKNCHTTREHPRMRLERDDASGVVIWTTPSKRTYRSLPPPTLGPGATTAKERRYRRWLLRPPSSILERRLIHGNITALRDRHSSPTSPSPPTSQRRRARLPGSSNRRRVRSRGKQRRHRG